MIKGVPSYAAPHEVGLYLAVETERSFNEMMQSIGIEELHSFEENGKVVLEAEAAEASKEKKANKIAEWLEARWNDIKRVFDQLLKGIQSMINAAKRKLNELLGSDKNKAKVVAAVERLKESGKDGKKKTFGKDYQWTEFKLICSGQSDVNDALREYQSFAKKAASGSMNYKEEKDAADKKVAGILGIKGDLTTAEIDKAITTKMRGEEVEIDKEYLKKNIDDIFAYATDFGLCSAYIRKFLANTKKAFDEAKKAVKDAAKQSKDDENLAGAAKIVKAESLFSTAASSAIMKNVRLRTNTSIRVILRLAIAAKQKEVKEEKKEEVKQESAIVPSSFQTELASLFEF